MSVYFYFISTLRTVFRPTSGSRERSVVIQLPLVVHIGTVDMKFSISFAVILSLGVVQAGRTNSFEKSEHERLLHRQKRFLIFPGGGTAKFVGKIESTVIERLGN